MQIKNPHSTLSFQLPRVVFVEDDYHNFGDLERNLRMATGINDIQVQEVGFDESDTRKYVGMVYVERSSHDKIGNEKTLQEAKACLKLE